VYVVVIYLVISNRRRYLLKTNGAPAWPIFTREKFGASDFCGGNIFIYFLMNEDLMWLNAWCSLLTRLADAFEYPPTSFGNFFLQQLGNFLDAWLSANNDGYSQNATNLDEMYHRWNTFKIEGNCQQAIVYIFAKSNIFLSLRRPCRCTPYDTF
jgi:hypothetical protein